MKTQPTTKIRFSFGITRYDQFGSGQPVLSFNLSEESVPKTFASIPYLCGRISEELARITGLDFPNLRPEDRGPVEPTDDERAVGEDVRF